MGVLNVLSLKLIIFSVAHLTLGQREYSEWSDFDECSVTCGGGIQSRTRKCLVDICKQNLEEIRNCRTRNCPEEDCSDSTTVCRTNSNLWCRVPSLQRLCRRSCGLCKGDAERPQPWTEYGSCSVTCGFGLKTRSNGKESQSITCALAACEEDKPRWSSWGTEEPCSVTCGGGFAIRRRECSVPGACNGVAEQRNRCQIQPCEEYSVWSKFNICSVKCGGGIQSRTRTCLVETCSEHLEEIRNCKTTICKKNKCEDKSTLCRFEGLKSRCSNKAVRRNCHKTCGVCKEASTWSEYGPCSVTCGAGLMTRNKESVSQSITCVLDKCPEDIAWTECSKSCGEGTRRRYFCSGTQCEWQFEGCVNGVCPEVSCETFGSTFKRRYNSTHECCDDAQKPLKENCRLQMPEIVSDKRIIGGQDAEEDQWPWMVAIYRSTGEFCGGSLISTKFVLSAAHCFVHESGLPHDVTGWKIYAGVLTLDSLPGDGLKIKKSYVHPDYSCPIADIALAELEDEVTFTNAIRPICLPHGEITPLEATCIVTGWGVSTEDYTITNHLQELAISNFDPKVCVHGYGKYEGLKSDVPFLEDNESYICAGSITRDIDSCLGDSGGPLACQRCDSCSWYVAGVVSFGPKPCALSGVPGIYTKVVYYEDWIFSTTNMTKQSLSCSKA